MNHYGFTAAFCNVASGHEKGNGKWMIM
jgi:hypothetical protein